MGDSGGFLKHLKVIKFVQGYEWRCCHSSLIAVLFLKSGEYRVAKIDATENMFSRNFIVILSHRGYFVVSCVYDPKHYTYNGFRVWIKLQEILKKKKVYVTAELSRTLERTEPTQCSWSWRGSEVVSEAWMAKPTDPKGGGADRPEGWCIRSIGCVASAARESSPRGYVRLLVVEHRLKSSWPSCLDWFELQSLETIIQCWDFIKYCISLFIYYFSNGFVIWPNSTCYLVCRPFR